MRHWQEHVSLSRSRNSTRASSSAPRLQARQCNASISREHAVQAMRKVAPAGAACELQSIASASTVHSGWCKHSAFSSQALYNTCEIKCLHVLAKRPRKPKAVDRSSFQVTSFPRFSCSLTAVPSEFRLFDLLLALPLVKGARGCLDAKKKKKMEFGYCSTFVCIWQLMFNHVLIWLKRFVS
jgi:hypothetical protein